MTTLIAVPGADPASSDCRGSDGLELREGAQRLHERGGRPENGDTTTEETSDTRRYPYRGTSAARTATPPPPRPATTPPPPPAAPRPPTRARAPAAPPQQDLAAVKTQHRA